MTPLCPARPNDDPPCLHELPCVEHEIDCTDIGWLMWGNAYFRLNRVILMLAIGNDDVPRSYVVN
jgi:hypothetical protein